MMKKIDRSNLGKPWTDAEDALLGTMSDGKLGDKLGRSEQGVFTRRRRLDIPPFKSTAARKWTKRELAMLGKLPDGKLAAKIGVKRNHVIKTRKRLGIAACQ